MAVIAGIFVAAAVVRELRTPARRRTWHGRVAGVVPYDLRQPTLDRVRRAWWAPGDPRLARPRAFGVGWSLNVGLVAHRLRELARHNGGASRNGSSPGSSER